MIYRGTCPRSSRAAEEDTQRTRNREERTGILRRLSCSVDMDDLPSCESVSAHLFSWAVTLLESVEVVLQAS
jgi:hypothetical protein